MNRALGRVSLGAVVLAASACSFTAGFDGFVGPGEKGDASPSDEGDARVLGRDGGDGNTATGDALAPVDGSTDGAVVDPNGPPAFVDGGSFCSTQTTATFCEDFDTEDLGKKWLREGAYAKLTSYSPRSSPNVFLVNAPSTSTGGTFVSKITHAFETPSTNLVLTFDLLPERTYLGASFFILAALEWPRGESKYSLRLVYSNGEIRLEESNLLMPPDNKDTYHPFWSLPNGRWSRVTIDLTAAGATPGAQISIDGVPAGTREVLTPTPTMDARPTLIMGAVFAGNPHTGWTLRYDDVTVTFR